MNKRRHPLAHWVQAVPVLHLALSATFRGRYVCVRKKEKPIIEALLAERSDDDSAVEVLDLAKIRAQVSS